MYNLTKSNTSYKYYKYIIKPTLLLRGPHINNKKIKSLKSLNLQIFNNKEVSKKNLMRLISTLIFGQKGFYKKLTKKKLNFVEISIKKQSIYEIIDIIAFNSKFQSNIILKTNFKSIDILFLEQFYPLKNHTLLSQYVKNLKIKITASYD
jgi:hypothetical protein